MNPNFEQGLGHGPEVALSTPTLPAERGSRRWSVRRMAAGFVVGAVSLSVVTLGLTEIGSKFVGVESAIQLILTDPSLRNVLGWQALSGGAVGALAAFQLRRSRVS